MFFATLMNLPASGRVNRRNGLFHHESGCNFPHNLCEMFYGEKLYVASNQELTHTYLCSVFEQNETYFYTLYGTWVSDFSQGVEGLLGRFIVVALREICEARRSLKLTAGREFKGNSNTQEKKKNQL